MDDAERYEILSRKRMDVHSYDEAIYQKILRENPELEGHQLNKTAAGKVFRMVARNFDLYQTYSNQDVELEFEFSGRRVDESVSKSSTEYTQFAKLLSCFTPVVENAVGIEVHNRNEAGYKPDRTLKNVYVMVGAFADGENVVPVKLEVKEFSDKPNKLYLAVALEGIKKDRVVSMGVPNNRSHVRTSPVSDRVLDLGVPNNRSHVQTSPVSDRVTATGVPNNRSHVRTSPVNISILNLLQNVNGYIMRVNIRRQGWIRLQPPRLNKKRTKSWLALNRLSLPLRVESSQLGSIRSIAYKDGKVKIENSPKNWLCSRNWRMPALWTPMGILYLISAKVIQEDPKFPQKGLPAD